MKINGFNAETQRTQSNAKADFSLRPSASPRLCVEKASRPQPSRRGVALIITVILLSVLTLMILAFLTLSRRERGAVTTTTDTASARLAADAALANAEGQILANVLATTNPYNFGLIVSTNYLPHTNGIYPDDLTNLFINPRAPVFIQTNSSGALDFRFYLDLNRNGVDDPNGYLPETNSSGQSTGATNFVVGDPEWIGVLQRPDQPYGPNNPFVARFAFIALPIGGNALDLNAIHNQTRNLPLISANDGFLRNEGVGSWEINLAAFLADLNTNEWGQSVGSWPNPPVGSANFYQYNEPGNNFNKGYAFEDAFSILSYRYAYNYTNLAEVDNLFGGAFGPGDVAFKNDNIDGYSDGPLQTGFQLPGDIIGNDDPTLPWAGADNTNHFFSLPSDLFDTNKTSIVFTNRLWSAGTSNATYDRYTFYRLLSQLGTDSAPESGKMNLNYRNVTNGVVVPNLETNFYSWTAIEFFTNAADRMLRDYSQEWLVSNPSNYVATFNITNNFGITNIPVLVSNRFVYTPAVQRVLQLAANIYDATTNNTAALGNNYPSVFRPIFEHDNLGNVFITGYTNLSSTFGPNTVTGTGDPQMALPYDVANVTNLSPNFTPITDASGSIVNVYGVPWIIGAKKGFPNFNEFSMESIVGVTRRLQLTRTTNNGATVITGTNQMYTMCISNWLGVECWNSYTNNYVPVPLSGLSIVVWDNLSMVLTNDDGMAQVFLNPPTDNLPLDNSTNIITPPYWPGSPLPWSGDGHPNANSFVIPLLANVVMQLNPGYNANWWVYRSSYATSATMPAGFTQPCFVPDSYFPANSSPPSLQEFENTVPGFAFPHFGLLTTNRLQVFMLDGNHVIDYVQFTGPNSARDLNAEISFADYSDNNGVWNTNLSTSSSTFDVPYGIVNQIRVSKVGQPQSEDGLWRSDPEAIPLGGSRPDQQAYFNAFFLAPGKKSASTSGGSEQNLALSVQAPYAPTRYVVQYITWQANDPLVHYIASDLNYTLPSGSSALQPGETNTFYPPETVPILTDTNANLGQLNTHYKPWGRAMQVPGVDASAYNPAIKDPLVWQSQDWDFPTNKFPTVGWLGRVHRGTPWQTVYLKAANILAEPNVGLMTWVDWSGDFISSGFDATNSAPVQDRLLFDLFTTAFNDNATRGQLSVNVGAKNGPSLAAWSALFSGVIALSNNAVSAIILSFDPLTEGGVQRNGSLTNFTTVVINPAGPAGASSALGQIVTNINQTREAFTNVYGVPAFEHIGDILAAPALTVSSPFLNWNDAVQQQNGISDEMYEWLPQQVMSLLRVGGSPQTPMRYVIYSYGQALKPAPNSIYTGGGSLFGMVTNYQIVSEAATRAVVRFNSTLTNIVTGTTNSVGGTNWFSVPVVTNNNVVIERFNVLPPD
jgi:hypothetical protein